MVVRSSYSELLPAATEIGEDTRMKTVRLALEISLPDDARVLDVQALLAAWKFVLRGFFPQATVKTSLPLPERAPAPLSLQ